MWEKYVSEFPPQSRAMFAEIIGRQLPPLDSVEAVLGQAFADADAPQLVGVVNPYNSPVVSDGGFIFIGLNHYLGADSEAYAGFPEYIRRNKTLRRLPVDVVEEYLLDKYPMPDSTRSVLNMLLYVGAIHNAALHMLPDNTSEATVLGMTDVEYRWCLDNEQRIWQKLIEDNMLYSSDPDLLARLFAPAPAATLINANAPGNTMHFIGLKIAQAYERNTGLDALPTAEYVFDHKTLIKSKYTPRNVTR